MNLIRTLRRWCPALLMMTAIFAFSSRSSDELPSFYLFDALAKKGGHMVGYGLLAASYIYALNHRDRKSFYLAWFLAILYAFTDEYHQSFVASRHASIWDVMVFDNFGAILALCFISWRNKSHA
ncbi:MAG: VanZ family protein [Anaerolineales bacterium]|nr:VanZ family protein [Anaerolineales bacterium]